MTASSAPLAGVRVLDFSSVIAGPHCTLLLASMGAEVVKIEPPEGELLRNRPPLRDGHSAFFGRLNGGKKAIVLDLKRPEAVAVAKRLIARSDVVMENFRPGVMKRLGLDWDSVRALKADLIYCSVSGYGQTGPSAHLPAYAPVVHAASGYDLAHLAYQDERDKPDMSGIYVADVMSATYAWGAIVTALLHRKTTGEGQRIDVSMLESTLSVLTPDVEKAQFPSPKARLMIGPVTCGDGWVLLAPASERNFQDMARAVGREDWLTDPRFAAYGDRRVNWPLLLEELEQWSRRRSSVEVEALWSKAGVPCSRYRTVAEALADPQLKHRDALAPLTDGGGTFNGLHPPFRFSSMHARTPGEIPRLGQHTDEVLAGAGYSGADIAALRAAGAIR